MDIKEYKQELANISALARDKLEESYERDDAGSVALGLVERLAMLMLEMGATARAE